MPPKEVNDLLILTDATSKVFGAPSDAVAVQDGGGGAPGGGSVWAHSREMASSDRAG